MRYLLIIFILTLFIYSEKDERSAIENNVQATHEYWGNYLAAIQLNTNDNCFELSDNNDLDGPAAILIDLRSESNPYFAHVEKVMTSGSKIFLNTLTFSLIDLPPPTVS